MFFCSETWSKASTTFFFDAEEHDQKSLNAASSLTSSVSKDDIDLKNEHAATRRTWDDVLKGAQRKELASLLEMCTGDERFVFLSLLDSIVIDEKSNTRLLDETLHYIEWPLTPEWARHLYTSYKERVFKKERHMWEEAYKRLTRDIEEESLFSTTLVSVPPTEPEKD